MYAILRVSVKLKHPPDIELVLRKRICLRFGRSGLFNMKFSRTGVTYEVVTGAPKVSTLLHLCNCYLILHVHTSDYIGTCMASTYVAMSYNM